MHPRKEGTMNKLIVPAIALAVALVGCSHKGSDSSSASSSPSGGDLKVSTVFSPNPPRQGPEGIIVTVKDADGNAVRGAMVAITTNMPNMSMKGPRLAAVDNGDGTYSARTTLSYATLWVFDVKATSSDGKTGTMQMKADVR
jgi:hypothetical protein